MKQTKRNTYGCLLAVFTLIITLLALGTLPALADPVGYIDVPLGTNLIGGVATTTNSTVSTTLFYLPAQGAYVSSGTFKVPQNAQLILQPNVTSAGVGTAATNTFIFNFGTDNNATNLSTVNPITVTLTQNGVLGAVGYTVIPFTNVTGAAYGQLTSYGVTGTNTVNLNYFRIGYKSIN